MKQNNIQIPEGYINSSLGIIPNDWEVKKLGDGIKELVAGISVNSVDDRVDEKGFGILKTSAVSKGKFYKDENKRIIEKDLYRAKVKPKKNNLIISRMNTPDLVGECGFITKDYDNIYLPDRLWQTVFKSTSCFTPQYINYLLNTSEYRKLIKDMATGTSNSMKNITKMDWLSIKVALPPLPQQQKIANVLDTWDEAIEKQSTLIDKLTERKRGLMQQLLTGKKRLAGFNEEWKDVRLGEICEKIANGITYDTNLVNGYPVTRIETISKGTIDYAKIGFAQEMNNIESYKLQVGDILFSHINSIAHIGKVAIYKGEKPLYHGMNLLLLRTSMKANCYYLFYFLCSVVARNKIKSFAKQAVNQASVNTDELKKWLMRFPSLPEQTAIANILTVADKEIELAKSKLELLRNQKSGLMQQLLTGETRVKI